MLHDRSNTATKIYLLRENSRERYKAEELCLVANGIPVPLLPSCRLSGHGQEHPLKIGEHRIHGELLDKLQPSRTHSRTFLPGDLLISQ